MQHSEEIEYSIMEYQNMVHDLTLFTEKDIDLSADCKIKDIVDLYEKILEAKKMLSGLEKKLEFIHDKITLEYEEFVCNKQSEWFPSFKDLMDDK